MRKHTIIEVTTAINKIEVGPNNQGISHLEYVELEALVTTQYGNFHWQDKFSATRFARKESTPQDWALKEVEAGIIQALTWLELLAPLKDTLDLGSLRDWLPKSYLPNGRSISDIYGTSTDNLGTAFWQWLHSPGFSLITPVNSQPQNALVEA